MSTTFIGMQIWCIVSFQDSFHNGEFCSRGIWLFCDVLLTWNYRCRDKMIMKENPLRSKKITNLEIGSKNNQPPQLSRRQKWRILCGPVNISITAVVIAVGVGLFYLFYMYVGGFARERLWLVFVLANLSCLLALSFVFRTCLAIHKRSDKNCRSRNKKQKRGQCGPQRAPVALRKTVSCYHSVFDIGGKYYFSKLVLYFLILFEVIWYIQIHK